REQRGVVVPDDRDVAGYGQAAEPGRPYRPERHEVGAAQDSGGATVEQPSGGGGPALDAEQRQLDQLLQSVRGHPAPVSGQLALYRQVSLRSADEPDAPVAERHEMVYAERAGDP